MQHVLPRPTRRQSSMGGLPLALAIALVASLAWTRGSLAAQTPAPSTDDPPPDIVERVVTLANDPATSRFVGDTRIGVGREITGDVVVINGNLFVAGRVLGDVIVANGSLSVEPGAVIGGSVLVIGGRVRTLPRGAAGGDVTQYAGRLDLLVRDGEVDLAPGVSVDRSGLYVGGARITVRAGTNYNRAEGLPVLFGPIFRSGGTNPLRFEALGIWRTQHERTRDELGYEFRLEQAFGPADARFAVGGGAFSRVTPIEDWGLSDLEASLSSFLLHVDPRDYHEERGWSAWLRGGVPGTDVTLGLTWSYRDFASLSVASPWSVLRNDEPWRPLPVVAEGTLHSLEASFTFDGRNDSELPTDGWYAEARATAGLGGDLALPYASIENVGADVSPRTPVPTGFRSGFVDLRRYARLSPNHDLALRVLAAGSLGGDALPPQFQHALGGEGSLPAFPLLRRDCGARDVEFDTMPRGSDEPEPAFARYGCARIALFQAEYRGKIPFLRDAWNRDDWSSALDLTPSWVLFFNAGRGWSRQGGVPNAPTVADFGAGVLIGKLGLYLAHPLSGEGGTTNFFVRLQRRF